MPDGNGSARGRVYAPLEGLLKSGGEELLLDPPAPPGFNIGVNGNDSARGRVYAPLEGLLKSGGEELLLDPPAPPGFNIGVMVVCLDLGRWNSLCTTASSSREISFWRKAQLSILKSGGNGGNGSVHRHRRKN